MRNPRVEVIISPFGESKLPTIFEGTFKFNQSTFGDDFSPEKAFSLVASRKLKLGYLFASQNPDGSFGIWAGRSGLNSDFVAKCKIRVKGAQS